MAIQKRIIPNTNALRSSDYLEPTVLPRFGADTEDQQQNLYDSIEEAMQKDFLNEKSAQGEKQKYDGSAYQIKTYENLESSDPLYARYISQTYGSYNNFLFTNQLVETQSPIFDPRYDRRVDVTIITKDKFYKSNHISAIEMIMEAMSGICTIDYIKKDGRPNKLVATLDKEKINSNKSSDRTKFFSPLPGERIVMWNIIKQEWSSFYMSNLIRFVRDDTIGIE
jgi:hypothetical protein